MKREIKKYLFDIKVSIESIFDYLGQKRDFFEFQQNKLLRRAIERELEIIGEATNRILKFDKDIQIENARLIIDTRNWVIHGYDKVDDVVIWGIGDNKNHNDSQNIPNSPRKDENDCYLYHELISHTDLGWANILRISSLWIDIDLVYQSEFIDI